MFSNDLFCCILVISPTHQPIGTAANSLVSKGTETAKKKMQQCIIFFNLWFGPNEPNSRCESTLQQHIKPSYISSAEINCRVLL